MGTAKNFLVNQEAFVKIKGGCGGSWSYEGSLPFFMRMDAFPEMLLVGKTKEKVSKESIDSTLDFFSRRFPTFVIALYSSDSFWLATNRGDVKIPLQISDSFEAGVSWLRKYLGSVVSDRFEPASEWSPLLYDAFYKTSYIANRKNLKQFRKRLPLHLFDKNSIEQRLFAEVKRDKPNTTLLEFV